MSGPQKNKKKVEFTLPDDPPFVDPSKCRSLVDMLELFLELKPEQDGIGTQKRMINERKMMEAEYPRLISLIEDIYVKDGMKEQKLLMVPILKDRVDKGKEPDLNFVMNATRKILTIPFMHGMLPLTPKLVFVSKLVWMRGVWEGPAGQRTGGEERLRKHWRTLSEDFDYFRNILRPHRRHPLLSDMEKPLHGREPDHFWETPSAQLGLVLQTAFIVRAFGLINKSARLEKLLLDAIGEGTDIS